MYYNPPAGIAISLPIHRAHGIVTCNPHISGQIANLVIWYRDISRALLFFKKKFRGGGRGPHQIKSALFKKIKNKKQKKNFYSPHTHIQTHKPFSLTFSSFISEKKEEKKIKVCGVCVCVGVLGRREEGGRKTYGIHDRYTTIIRTTRQLRLKSLCQEKPPFLK